MLPCNSIEIGALFNLAKTLVLVPHKKKNAKSKSPSTRRIKKNPNFQLVNKPSRIGPHKVLQLSLIVTVFYLLVKNKKRGEVGWGLKERGLIVKTFFH